MCYGDNTAGGVSQLCTMPHSRTTCTQTTGTQEEHMLKRFIFTMLAALLHSHLPYTVTFMNPWVASCNFATEWPHKLQLFCNLVTLRKQGGHLNWYQIIKFSVCHHENSLKVQKCLDKQHDANTCFIKSCQQNSLSWILLAQNKFRMTLNKPTGYGNIQNFIQIHCEIVKKADTGAWRYRVSVGTSRSGGCILWLGEVQSLICNFYLSVAARKTVWADPSLRYTSMLLGR